ncbi:hypothetical protein MSAN_01533000 [Mycena sanguinolenta]|uniref:Uncharacterized protein n=1 Tax=Mycena sanguinolenta TaxID=230812 RepID=A0A8H6Y533_9AGAR|nr:hypothetical protein MSAN_01533000 [Mycena sanguinolenta]
MDACLADVPNVLDFFSSACKDGLRREPLETETAYTTAFAHSTQLTLSYPRHRTALYIRYFLNPYFFQSVLARAPPPSSMRRSVQPSASRPTGETYLLEKAPSPPLKIDSSSVAPTSPVTSYPSGSASSSSLAFVPTRPLLDGFPTETRRDEDLRKVALKRRSLERTLSLSFSFSLSLSRGPTQSDTSVAPVPSPAPTSAATRTHAAISAASSASSFISSSPSPSSSAPAPSSEFVSASAGKPTRPPLKRPTLKSSTVVPITVALAPPAPSSTAPTTFSSSLASAMRPTAGYTRTPSPSPSVCPPAASAPRIQTGISRFGAKNPEGAGAGFEEGSAVPAVA